MPAAVRWQLYIEFDAPIATRRFAGGVRNAQDQAAMQIRGAAIALMLVTVLRAVIERQFAGVLIPGPLQRSMLFTRSRGFLLIGEVRVDFNRQLQLGRTLGEIR